MHAWLVGQSIAFSEPFDRSATDQLDAAVGWVETSTVPSPSTA
jgi:hypothetical protein